MFHRRWDRGRALTAVAFSTLTLLLGIAAVTSVVALGGSARAATTYQCVGPQTYVFNNWNGGAVGNGGTDPMFSTPGGQPYCLISISDYHWNGGAGAVPGTIALIGQAGTLGPYQATGSSGQGNAPDVNWTATPPASSQPVIIQGTYRCDDSDPATWSQNSGSGGSNGQGFCKVLAQPAQTTQGTTTGPSGTTPPPAVCTGVPTIDKTLVHSLNLDALNFDSFKEVPSNVASIQHEYEVAASPGANELLIHYQIVVVNNAACDFKNLDVTDFLSSKLAFGSVTLVSEPTTLAPAVITRPRDGEAGGTLVVNIPLLPKSGGKVTIDIGGVHTLPRGEVNSAALSGVSPKSSLGIASTRFKVVSAAATRDIKATPTATTGETKATTAKGKAQDARVARKRQPAENAAAVRVVEIAIERLSGRKAGRCTWLRNKQAKFKQRSCRKPIWLKATGTRHWTVTYSRLPPGRYEVFALAISNNGLSADTFAPRAGDTKIFRVR